MCTMKMEMYATIAMLAIFMTMVMLMAVRTALYMRYMVQDSPTPLSWLPQPIATSLFSTGKESRYAAS